MKVYGHPLSSCTRKVLMTVAEKGAKAELEVVDLLAGAHKSPAHLGRHAFGMIPVLEDDGFRLIESRAIIRYLDARLPGPSLTPRDVQAVGQMDQWLSVDASYVAPHARALAVERIMKPHAGLPRDLDAERRAEEGLERALGVLEDALSVQPYLVGTDVTLADISLVPYIASLPMIGAPHVIEGAPHVRSWLERMTSRPS